LTHRHDDDLQGERDFLFRVSLQNIGKKVTVYVGGVDIAMLIDSGASCNVIDRLL